MYRLFIFEGVDKIGKTETLLAFADKLRKQGRTVITPMNNIDVGFSNFHTYVKTIPNFIDKTYTSLITTHWCFNTLKTINNDVDVIMDRLHLSGLAYATYDRKKELLRLFGGKANLLSFVYDFEKSLIKTFDSITLFGFVVDDNNYVFKDDNAHESIHHTGEYLQIVNARYKRLFESTTLSSRVISVKPNDIGYFNTQYKFNQLLQNDKC